MKDTSKYGGMTVNERLFAAGLLGAWDAAVRGRNRSRMIEILQEVNLPDDAVPIADTILANPKLYGF
jgi:hypothetical protein